MSPQIRSTSAILIGAVALTACSPGTRPARTVHEPARTTLSDPPPLAKPKADSADRRYTMADVHFMSGMIGHHAQAIVMARLAPSPGASHSIRTLAERIINAQEDEIAIMQQWLRDRGQLVPEARPSRTMKMTVNGVEHEHAMPGMLTDDQLKQLDAARGKEFDRLFLQFMIQHHQGAVAMVRDLIGSVGAAHDDTVFKLAS